ncbi:Phenylalanine--tRNA ligase beta subunit [Candidatus Profftia lariciata]|uniref:phenylalanine--tRNA ligase subunit beta n=1 Tax=Candidatus Profftia lariciata TaxID=1987921 RepID=UPI001D032E21|nr:phenylalanine--tRNA ligase subunit beta [Candidatus Profftia lariciata]UDG81518.1 Phenylalanine--tRNA ligase beta subunit [Candidatus Profftia lariciata]
MKFSELWLREWVNPNISSEELSEQLTMIGLEVDVVRPLLNTFNGVYIGKIIECNRHPKANKLWIINVDIGKKDFLRIVCKTQTCHIGLIVAVAIIGAILPGGIKVEIKKIHGQSSEGILCSLHKLGLSEYHDEIIELSSDAPIGTDIREYLQLNDNIIEIRVTPNRADCLSIIGIARDIATLNKLILNEPKIEAVPAIIKDICPITVEAVNACPRYLGRVIKSINLNVATPLWMHEKLRRCGIWSVNPVVDVTNYVLLELGQPMHAFDLHRIEGSIVVRMAKKEGEKLILLNGNHVTLLADTLVVADQKKVLSMGGIIGGAYSSINTDTQDIMLECAYFNPLYITGRARRQCLHTHASHRYERGVDYTLPRKAIERATSLLIDICGGQVGPITEVTNIEYLPKPNTITLRRKKLDSLIGYHITDIEVTDILERLGFKIHFFNDTWQVIAPSWSCYMEFEEDLVEEISRIYGYNNIPSLPIKADLIMNTHCEAQLPIQRVKTMLIDRGYQEAITYSFVDPNIQMLLHPSKESLILPNPISTEMSAMRLSLWTGLLSAVIYNQNRQQSRIRLFETGLRFIPNTTSSLGVSQDVMLAGVITGNRYQEHWILGRQNVDFYDLKGDVEAILELTCKINEVQFKKEIHPTLHPGQSAAIYLTGKRIGYIGLLHPMLERKLHLNNHIVMFEVEWESLATRRIPKASKISRYLPNRRDIAIIVADHIPAEDILTECKKVSINKVINVNLFDVYRGQTVGHGYKSLAISLIFQNTTSALKEQEMTDTVATCVKALQKRFQASLRN